MSKTIYPNLSSEVMANYVLTLKSKLENFRAANPSCLLEEGDCSIDQLLWMVNELVRLSPLSTRERKSFSSMNRWIGYVRGVMIKIGLTTLARERATYTQTKNGILAQQNIDLYLDRGVASNRIIYHEQVEQAVSHMSQAAGFAITLFVTSGQIILPFWDYMVFNDLLDKYEAREGAMPSGCDTLLVGIGEDHDVILGACCGKNK